LIYEFEFLPSVFYVSVNIGFLVKKAFNALLERHVQLIDDGERTDAFFIQFPGLGK